MTILETQIAELRPVTNEWRRVVLSDVCRFMGGGTPSKENPTFWNGTIPWVSPKDMKQARLSDSSDHISEEAVKESATSIAPAGSILVLVRGMGLAAYLRAVEPPIRLLP